MNIEEINPDKNKDYLIYTNYSACKFCGGMCCKTDSGIYSPDDFKYPITPHLILHLLLTKKFTIDSLGDNDDKLYYLRPRYIEEDPIKPSLFGGGVCINWSLEKGCSLEESERPFQCRMLIPLFDKYQCQFKPSNKASKSDVASLWIKHKEAFELVINNFNYIKSSISYLYVPDENGNINIYNGIQEKMNVIREILNQI